VRAEEASPGLIVRNRYGYECRLVEPENREYPDARWLVHSFNTGAGYWLGLWELEPLPRRTNPAQVLVVMQGPPGGGKSTLATSMADGLHAVVCSTDDYQVEPDGVYRFKPEAAASFHAMNQERVLLALRRGENVVVDNTNTTRREAKPYVASAVTLGIPVVFVRCEGRWPNVHGVPPERVELMRNRMEELTVESCLAAPDWGKA